MGFGKKDLWSSIATGLITGFSAWQIADFLDAPRVFGLSFAFLLAAVPILWIIGVNLGYFLGRFLPFFNQFGRFAAVGFTNAAVDFGILYLLIGISGVSSGGFYAAFKALSFAAAAIHSYLWNKFWVFDSAKSGAGLGQEMAKFFAVTITAIVINVSAATVIVNVIGPQFGLTDEAWAGIGAAVGSATALVFSFVGFRTVVFKK